MIMKISKVLGMLEHYAGNETIAVQAFLNRCQSLLDIALLDIALLDSDRPSEAASIRIEKVAVTLKMF